jgi:hypothetical protein
MKQLNRAFAFKTVFTLILTALATFTFAQANVEVNGEDVGSWFSRNWLWVVGGVVLFIILISLFSGSSSRSRTTTVTRDDGAGYRKTTTTEVDY